jgi:hypothetical protein
VEVVSRGGEADGVRTAIRYVEHDLADVDQRAVPVVGEVELSRVAHRRSLGQTLVTDSAHAAILRTVLEALGDPHGEGFLEDRVGVHRLQVPEGRDSRHWRAWLAQQFGDHGVGILQRVVQVR